MGGGKGKIAVAVVLAVILLSSLFTVVIGGSEDCDTGGGETSAGADGVPAGEYSKPLKEGTYTNTSGYRSPDRPNHLGIDLAGDLGTPYYAFAGGVVEQAGPASGFGNWIVINHNIDGKRYSTVYGHSFPDGLLVKAGDHVKAGQLIGKIGNAGGSTGPHMHFEVWEGGRNTGGHDVNPQPWFDKGVEPGSGGGSGGGASSSPSSDAPQPSDAAKLPDDAKKEKPSESSSPSSSESSSGSDELPDSPKIQSKEHLQKDTIRVARAVAQKFPDLKTIGGWRPNDPYPDHPSGRAADIMIPDYDSDKGRKLGDDIKAYLKDHADEFHIQYMIWRKVYIPTGQPESPYTEGDGSPTGDHYDHVHVTTVGGGIPGPGEKYAAAPGGGGSGSSSSGQCDTGPTTGGRDLAEGEIPEELRKWIKHGGHVCPEVDSPLLAGLEYHESIGFQAHAVSGAGAQGYAQFTPETWAAHGAKVDDQGKVSGPPGSGSPNDPADASMAAARYLCELAKEQKPGIASGQLKGDPTALMLAGYNAGPGAVEQNGGVPPYAETQKYVVIVPKEAEKFVGKTD